MVGVDWRTPLDVATARIGPDRAVQGNLDPAVLLRALAGRSRPRCAGSWPKGRAAPGHVFNLGHGVLPETDPEVLTRVVALVHEVAASRTGKEGDLMRQPWRIAVVGGGISGLAAAVRLRDLTPADTEITVFEQSGCSAASCAPVSWRVRRWSSARSPS